MTLEFLAAEMADCTCHGVQPRAPLAAPAACLGGITPISAMTSRTTLTASSASYIAKPGRYGSSG